MTAPVDFKKVNINKALLGRGETFSLEKDFERAGRFGTSINAYMKLS